MSTPALRLTTVALTFGLSIACGPPPASPGECIPIDELLGTASRLWCDGYWTPQMDPKLTWNDEPAGAGGPVCLPPASDGSCKVCPADEVLPAIEAELKNLFPPDSECQIEHWEVGCMRTPENAMESVNVTDYCCFEVALWGPGCDDTG